MDEKMCEQCLNFDKEHIGMDCTALCKITGTLAYAEDYGGNCMFYNVPKEQVIVLPCKVGDMVWQIKYCRCAEPKAYETKRCPTKVTVRTPKEYGSIMLKKEARWGDEAIGTICYKIIHKPFKLEWLTQMEKTVFLTKEEAEAELMKKVKEVRGDGDPLQSKKEEWEGRGQADRA